MGLGVLLGWMVHLTGKLGLFPFSSHSPSLTNFSLDRPSHLFRASLSTLHIGLRKVPKSLARFRITLRGGALWSS